MTNNVPGKSYYSLNTWVQKEEYAYPNGGQTRKAVCRWPDGKLRVVYAGIPDTAFSIPAHGRLRGNYVRGWIGRNTSGGPLDGELEFRPSASN